MHNSYYFFVRLTEVLRQRLKGFTLVSCFSQSKDELVAEFNNGHGSFFIKASLLPAFQCLSFPSKFARAKKNSIDLFTQLLMRPVTDVGVFKNDRSFYLALTGEAMLIFKMHGTRANVLAAEGNQVTGLFRCQLADDLRLTPASLHREIDFSYEAFQQHRQALPQHYFTFSKAVWNYLTAIGFESLPAEQQSRQVQHLHNTLLSGKEIFLAADSGQLSLSLLPTVNAFRTYTDPVQAITDFYFEQSQARQLAEEKRLIRQRLMQQIDASLVYADKARQRCAVVEQDEHFTHWANLIMANLHAVAAGASEMTVADFYNDHQAVTIPLKPALSPQKNAEVYYRKAKNQHLEIEKLKDGIRKKEADVARAHQLLAQLEEHAYLKDLRLWASRHGLERKKQKTEPALPFHEVTHMGYQIWIGKNAAANDVLTQQYAYKEDLWLHAKDVAGSHVLIKYQAGKSFPKEVVERAAELAAFHSKRKTDTLCPVLFTPKKFVRKPKGAAPGAVVVEREQVMLVAPAQ